MYLIHLLTSYFADEFYFIVICVNCDLLPIRWGCGRDIVWEDAASEPVSQKISNTSEKFWISAWIISQSDNQSIPNIVSTTGQFQWCSWSHVWLWCSRNNTDIQYQIHQKPPQGWRLLQGRGILCWFFTTGDPSQLHAVVCSIGHVKILISGTLKTETVTAENALAAFRKWHSDLVCFPVHVAAMFPCIHAALQTLKTNVFSEKTTRLVSGKPQRVCLSVNALFQEVKVLPEQQHNDGFMRQVFIWSTEQAETLCDLQRPASRGDIMVKFTAWHGLDLCECTFTFLSDQIQKKDVQELHV